MKRDSNSLCVSLFPLITHVMKTPSHAKKFFFRTKARDVISEIIFFLVKTNMPVHMKVILVTFFSEMTGMGCKWLWQKSKIFCMARCK